jgi:HlyD family secretion protein
MSALVPAAGPSAAGPLIEHAPDLPVPSLRRLLVLSLAVIVLGFGGLALWAHLARLDSATPATGVIVAAGKRKTVTLLDAGILARLLVREGEPVAAGQTLLLLDDVQARAGLDQARALYWGQTARAARLRAETRDARTLAFPQPLLDAASDPAVAGLIAAERHLFATRWEAFDATVRIGQAKIEQSQTQVAALATQREAAQLRLDLVRDELHGAAYLLNRGYETKPHVLELRRGEAELVGMIAQLDGQIAAARQAAAQTALEIISSGETRRSDASKDLQEAEAAILDAAQRVRGAEDIVAKRRVLAPEAGIVTDLRFFTLGSSIGAGQPILDLVPLDDHLLVEAQVAPNDIEHVQAGQRVNIRLTAYKQHQVPVLTGRLVYVAADRKQDDGHDPVFMVRAEIDRESLAAVPRVVLTAGMPADVLILGGRRSVLDFLLSPITDGLRHAMREE